MCRGRRTRRFAPRSPSGEEGLEAGRLGGLAQENTPPYLWAKGKVCARSGVTACRKCLWAGEIIALDFSEIVDFRATIARANTRGRTIINTVFVPQATAFWVSRRMGVTLVVGKPGCEGWGMSYKKFQYFEHNALLVVYCSHTDVNFQGPPDGRDLRYINRTHEDHPSVRKRRRW